MPKLRLKMQSDNLLKNWRPCSRPELLQRPWAVVLAREGHTLEDLFLVSHQVSKSMSSGDINIGYSEQGTICESEREWIQLPAPPSSLLQCATFSSMAQHDPQGCAFWAEW